MQLLAVLLAVVVLIAPADATAQLRTQLIASGLSAPVALVPDPLQPSTFYIVEQGGLVKVLVNGQVQGAPFIDLRSVISSGGERGLLGMAFSPDNRVFFNFTNSNGDTVIARFRRDPASPLRADPATRFDLMWPTGERFIRQPFANHNGGHLEFGPDGLLYIGLGDGGSANDPQNNAQNPFSLLGKMLRIDVAVTDSDQVGYRVPPSNPFVDQQPIAALGEIWSFGLRNPWRYSFDDVGAGATGAMFIGDVGQNAREEINAELAGAGGRNYGWRIREGRIPTPDVAATEPAYGPLADPIFDYGRTEGQAVTGGYLYRGNGLAPAYRERYFFADYVTSRVWSVGLTLLGNGEIAVTNIVEHTSELGGALGGVASFGRDREGELYLLTFSGSILKIVGDAGPPPAPPQNLTTIVNGQTVTVSWMPPADGSATAGYQLEAGSIRGAADLAVFRSAAAQTTLTFANVPPGTYYARVRSLNATASSAPSNEVIVMVGSSGCTQPPQAPTSFTSVVNGRTVTLLWSDPSSSSGAAQFVLEAGSAGGLANLAIVTVPGDTRSFSVQAPPGTYYVRVRGVNGCGASTPSDEIVVSVF